MYSVVVANWSYVADTLLDMAAEPAKSNVKDVVSYFNSLTRPKKEDQPKPSPSNVAIPRVKLKNYRNEMLVKSVTEDENAFELADYAKSRRSSKPDLVLRDVVDDEMMRILEELTGRLSEYDDEGRRNSAKGFVVRPQVKRRLRRISSNSRKVREGIVLPSTKR